jgi:hypothetical protein
LDHPIIESRDRLDHPLVKFIDTPTLFLVLHTILFLHTGFGLTAKAQKITANKLAKYRGTVKMSNGNLHFLQPYCEIDRTIVEQLKRDYEGEGCIKYEQSSWVPAIIDDTVLQQELQKLGSSVGKFRTTSKDKPPTLKLPREFKIECLYGKQRILAVDEFLGPSDRW